MSTVERDEWGRCRRRWLLRPRWPRRTTAVSRLARMLGQPVALLSRDAIGWHFEAEGFPEDISGPT